VRQSIEEQKASLDTARMYDSNAPLVERATAALNAAGHHFAAGYHVAAKVLNEKIQEKAPEVRRSAAEGLLEHDAKEREHALLAAMARKRLWDPTASFSERAAAAAASAGHAAAGSWHWAVKAIDAKTLENAPG
jgi:hypothetical protein